MVNLAVLYERQCFERFNPSCQNRQEKVAKASAYFTNMVYAQKSSGSRVRFPDTDSISVEGKSNIAAHRDIFAHLYTPPSASLHNAWAAAGNETETSLGR